MKKYFFFRIIRSIVSIFLVTTLTYALIYSLVPRRAIFQNDSNVSKLKGDPDKLEDYKNTAYGRMDYIDYYGSKQLVEKVQEDYPEVTTEDTAENRELYQQWADNNSGWEIKQFEISKGFYAVKELSLVTRVSRFYSDLIKIDHPWKINDPDNPDLKRSIKIENDDSVGWSLVGSGTQHKYLIYFNSQFPYIHQNIVTFNFGTSYPTFAGLPVLDVISDGQGKNKTEQIMIDGKEFRSNADIASREYTMTSQISSSAKKQYDDNYTTTESLHEDPSMVGTSMRMGIVGVIIAYLVAIPMSILMARFKGKLVDKVGIAIVTVLISVPSLAFIYFFRFIGNSAFNLPLMFPTLGAQDLKSWIMPTVILGLLSVPGLVIWVRRYMIDQQSADYVKFAKAKGLSAGEISRRHIFKNAIIPIANGIPGSIIGAIGGATITETIFAAPGMGKMLPDAIKSHNNPIVIGLVLIFTTISVLSVFLGDITMTIVDPRIKLNTSKGDE
ncbi:ABC transporter permease [Enterococcus timonensis]|uniref:ABC transporter permease n=1 Tax=Enterococcus timonensis TaxID=1852364 RepID=UPI0008DAFE9C|nr:ABC transporter permease [Enterococcus timonensis]